MMINIVLVLVFAWGEKAEFTEGLIGTEAANFAGGVAIGNEEKVSAAAGALDINAEALVFFLVEKGDGQAGAEDVAIEAVRTLGDLVFDDVEESEIVGGPGGAGDTIDAEGQEFVGVEILDFENELAEAGVVCGIGKESIVVADGEGAEAEKGVALGEGVEVQEDFFRRRVGGGRFRGGRFVFAAVDGVLLALLRPDVIGVATKKVGDAKVGLLNAAKHFLVEGLLEGMEGFHESVGEGVLFLEVGEDARVVLVAEPGVIVDPWVAVDDVLDGFARGDGGLGRRAGIAFGQWGSRQRWRVV